MDEQTPLLKIVQTWNISPTPEYRGFRCAACQQYKNESWYHWLHSEGFIVPLHLCNDICHQAFLSGSLTLALPSQRDKPLLTNPYSEKTKEAFEEIIEDGNTIAEPVLKTFYCDLCEQELEIDPSDSILKGWHVWYQDKKGSLTELHFDQKCAAALDIN